MEAFGAAYYDSAGNQRDPLADHGMNYARLKVWADPADGFNSKQRVEFWQIHQDHVGDDPVVDAKCAG